MFGTKHIFGGIIYMGEVKYKRIILKISGEALAGDKSFGLNHETLLNIAERVKRLRSLK